MKFLKFPHGRVWQYDDGHILGTVHVPDLPPGATDATFEQLAEAITGYANGITSGFSTDALGDGLFTFRAKLDVDDYELSYEELVWLTPASAELPALLAAQYRLTGAEAEHALKQLGEEYPAERVLRVADSARELRISTRWPEVSYARVTVKGTPFEIANWTSAQLSAAPTLVLCAMFATLASG